MLPDVFGRAGDLRSALEVLSAMITPAVLILDYVVKHWIQK